MTVNIRLPFKTIKIQVECYFCGTHNKVSEKDYIKGNYGYCHNCHSHIAPEIICRNCDYPNPVSAFAYTICNYGNCRYCSVDNCGYPIPE